MRKSKTRIIPGIREMKLNPFTLSFKDPNLESDFENDYYQKSLVQVRISFFLAIVLYGIFGILDAQIVGDIKNIVMLIRFMVIVPIGILVLISSYSHDFKKYKDISFAFSMILFGVGIITMLIITPQPMDFTYYAAMIITFIYVHVFISIRFIPSMLTGLIIFILYEFAAFFFIDIPHDMITKSNYYFISANILGIFSSYSIELYARRDFYIALELEEKRKKVNEINQFLEVKVAESTKQLREANEELKNEIQERKNAQHKISDSLQEKEVLLKEIHHRVKNNMQVISSLLFLQSEYVQDENVNRMFEESQNRIKSMSLIHEKLYQSKKLSNIDFNDYVSSLVENLFAIYHGYERINCVQKIYDIFLDINTAIPLGLLVNELVTNAIKHGFGSSESGNIIIELVELDKEHLELSVFNDGESFPDDIDLNKIDTFGFQLIQILVEQLNGDFTIQKDKGTKFIITLEKYPMNKEGIHE